MIFLKKMNLRFINNKGFSLNELMVSMAVSMIVSLTATVAFLQAVETYVRLIRQYEAEAEMSALMYSLRGAFTSAVKVVYGGSNTAAKNASTFRGLGNQRVGGGILFSINDISPGAVATYNGTPYLVGFFNREAGNFAQPSLVGTQIVYQQPNNAQRFSGAIYIDRERNAAALGSGWIRATPINSPEMFTRLTTFEINNVKVYDNDGSVVNNLVSGGTPCSAGTASCIGRPVMSAEVRMVMRYFTKGNPQNWQWCNNARANLYAACAMNNVNYYDVDRKMTVVFANNAYEPLEYLPRRPFGNLYFLRPWAPLSKGP